MVDNQEKVTIPKLIAKTGLSREFFYRNLIVRKLIDQALEQHVGMTDPKREILDMVLRNEIAVLQEKIRVLQSENDKLKNENQNLQRTLDRKNAICSVIYKESNSIYSWHIFDTD